MTHWRQSWDSTERALIASGKEKLANELLEQQRAMAAQGEHMLTCILTRSRMFAYWLNCKESMDTYADLPVSTLTR